MSLGDNIRKGTAWLASGSIAMRLMQFAFGIVLARLLAPAEFGMLVTMSIFTGLAGFVAGGGMGPALVQAKAVSDQHFHVVFTMQLAVCSIIYCMFYIISPWFAEWYETPIYEDLLRVSALTFLLRPFANIQNSRLHREMRYKATAIIGLSSALIGSSACVIMAFYGMGVWSLVFGGLINAIISNVLLRVVARQSTRLFFDKAIAKSVGSYGIKIQALGIINYLKTQTPSFIISVLESASFLGLYNKADSLRLIPFQTIMGAVYQTVFRALSKEQDNLDLSRYIYFRAITLTAVYTIPFYIGFWWLAEPLIGFVYGEKWLPAAEPLQILALTGLVLVSNPSGAVLAAQNRLGRELRVQLEILALLALAVYIGLSWGFSGVAWATVPVHFYFQFRMALLALDCLNASFANLFKSLAPAYLLGGILFLTLAFTDTLISHWRSSATGMYLLVMICVGGGAFGLSFLYLPIALLEAEASRWKQKFGLPLA